MKKLLFALSLLLGTYTSKAQELPEVDLGFSLAIPHPTNDTFVLAFGDSLQAYMKISNEGPGDLDTLDYVLFDSELVPAGFYLVATDTTTYEKAYLAPNEHFIHNGINFLNTFPGETEDLTFEFCFYLVHDVHDVLFYQDSNPLNDTFCIKIKFLKDPNAVSIADRKLSQDINLYPNPSTDKLTLQLSALNGLASNYAIVNVLGQEVMKGALSNGTKEQALDVSSLAKGMYTISVYRDNEILATKKFIKQ